MYLSSVRAGYQYPYPYPLVPRRHATPHGTTGTDARPQRQPRRGTLGGKVKLVATIVIVTSQPRRGMRGGGGWQRVAGVRVASACRGGWERPEAAAQAQEVVHERVAV